MKKRILSIVLAIAMLATLVPVGIFASAESTAQPASEITISETIDSVDVLGYVAPTVGADIAESLAGLTVPEGASYSISDAYWYNETLDRSEGDGVFLAGCIYRLNIKIYTNSGYVFADDLVMQLNGDASLVDLVYSYSGTNYAFISPAATQLEGELITVDAVNVNGYVAPTAGADIAESLAGLSVPEGANYSISDAYWYNETFDLAVWDGTFTAGYAYRLCIYMDVASGYVFADELVMQLNGDASLADPDSSYSDKDYAYLFSVDTQLEGELITVDTVNVNGYVAPTVGADIADSLAGLTAPEGAPYIINPYWYNETLDSFCTEGTFIAGYTYRLNVDVFVASGYIFADDLVMQFNGDASLVDRDFGYCGFDADSAYLYSVATQLEGELITVDTVNVNGYVAPTAGADIAESLAGITVPEGAPYSISEAYWYNETLDCNEGYGTFIAGYTYRLRVRIDVASGCVFANELVMQFNGDASLVDTDRSYSGAGYAYLYSVATELSAPAEFFTFASGADTTYVSIDETNGFLIFKAGSKTAADVIALFADANISISKAAGDAVTGTAKVGTTCIITSTINGESKSLTVVVVGDVNGDGSINSMDYSKINQVAKNKSTITDAAVLYAANTSPTSSNINSLDISRLTSFMKKKITNF
jgi:hypothetical protein